MEKFDQTIIVYILSIFVRHKVPRSVALKVDRETTVTKTSAFTIAIIKWLDFIKGSLRSLTL